MKHILISIAMLLIVSIGFSQAFYNYDVNFQVRNLLKTKDLEVTGDVDMDTLDAIIDYADSVFYFETEVDSLLDLKLDITDADSLFDLKLDTDIGYLDLDSLSVDGLKIPNFTAIPELKITKIGTSTADTLLIEIGGETWYMLKRP